MRKATTARSRRDRGAVAPDIDGSSVHKRGRSNPLGWIRRIGKSRETSPPAHAGTTQKTPIPESLVQDLAFGDNLGLEDGVREGKPSLSSPHYQLPTDVVRSESTAAYSSRLSQALDAVGADDPSLNIRQPLGAVMQETGQQAQCVPIVVVEDRSTHHTGDTHSHKNFYHGPVNIIGHVSNLSVGSPGMNTQGSHAAEGSDTQRDGVEVLALWNDLPRRRDVDELEPNSYLEGSREEEVQFILDWIDDPNSGLVLFVHGPAGIGKSTLSRHVTHRLSKANRLAASVSRSCIPVDSSSPKSVVKLIARDIGERYRQLIRTIVDGIQSCKGASLEDHFWGLLSDPILSLGLDHPVVALFDAVDEWPSHVAFLNALPCLKSASRSIKFILLGRSDPRARGFKDECISPYPLQPVSVAVMEQYLNKQFDSIQWKDGRRPLPWRVTRLAKLADGLFIWAMVVCSLLQKRLSRTSPSETLDAILDTGRTIGDTERLAKLYHQAIMWLFPEPEDLELFQEYLGAILALQEPLPVADFARLTKLPVDMVISIQADLRALQIKQPGGGQADAVVYPGNSLFHLSFIEYTQSLSTPPQTAFYLPLANAHSQLAECCLTLLPSFLPSTPDLHPYQRYAVKYLTTHIHLGSPLDQVGWKQTKTYTLLQQLGIELWTQWRVLWLSLVWPGAVFKESKYDSGDGIAQVLHRAAKALNARGTSARPFRISCLEVVVRLQPENVMAWSDLGWACWNDAVDNKSATASQRAVVAHQTALQAGHASTVVDQGKLLFTLATALETRFDIIGHTEDLIQSVKLHREALALRPPGHPDRTTSLNNLASVYHHHPSQAAPMLDVDEIIDLQRENAQHWPPTDKNHIRSLTNLGIFLHHRSKQTGSIPDIDEAIQLERKVQNYCPPESEDYVRSLHSLTIFLHHRSEQTGSISNIDEAIQLQSKVLKHRPPGHQDHVRSLRTLSLFFYYRFQQTGFLPNIDEAIQLNRETLKHHPPEHHEHVCSLRNLSGSLHDRSEHTGSIPDIDEAIQLAREVLKHCLPEHKDYASSLRSLAISLYSRFQQLRSVENLDETIILDRQVLALCPPGHNDRAEALTDLATSLHLLAQETGSTAALEEASRLEQEAEEL